MWQNRDHEAVIQMGGFGPTVEARGVIEHDAVAPLVDIG